MRPDETPPGPLERALSRWLFPLAAVVFGGWMVATHSITFAGILLCLAFMSPGLAAAVLAVIARQMQQAAPPPPDDEPTASPPPPPGPPSA